MNTPTNMYTQSQPQLLNVVLVPNMSAVDTYPVNPGTSLLFLDEGMTEFRMKSKDINGFPRPDRIWSMKETTPPPVTPGSNFATKEEMNAVNDKLDKVLSVLEQFTK